MTLYKLSFYPCNSKKCIESFNLQLKKLIHGIEIVDNVVNFEKKILTTHFNLPLEKSAKDLALALSSSALIHNKVK